MPSFQCVAPTEHKVQKEVVWIQPESPATLGDRAVVLPRKIEALSPRSANVNQSQRINFPRDLFRFVDLIQGFPVTT